MYLPIIPLFEGSPETQCHAVKLVDSLLFKSGKAIKELKKHGVVRGLQSVIRAREINPADWKLAVRSMQTINAYYGTPYKLPSILKPVEL